MGKKDEDELCRRVLADFARTLRKETEENVRFWLSKDEETAKHRLAVFQIVHNRLVDAAKREYIPLQDLGFVDYTFPTIDQLKSRSE